MIRWDDGSDPRRIYDMWQRNFRDPVSYADFYFSQVYGKNKVMVRTDDEDRDLMGMIHLNPYSFKMRGESLAVHYIVGVATEEAYRRQGVMRDLLRECFSWLREEGECLTYLMPADPAYYLPFDFRFGRPQLEMEFYMEGDPQEDDFEYRESLSGEDLASYCAMENGYKSDHYDLFTEITPDYLIRLEKEARADFGQIFYVFDQGRWIGRFCVAAEHDCLILSRVFCGEERPAFLSSILRFVRRRFHYGNHQIILDHSWEDILASGLSLPGLRTMPVKARQKIMFRILDLEKLGPCLRSEKDGSFDLVVRDRFFPVNEGLYTFTCRQGQVFISRKPVPDSEKKEDSDLAGEDGLARELPVIDIADLTAWLFGGMSLEDLFTKAGSEIEDEASDEISGETSDKKSDGNPEGRKDRVWDFLTSIAPVGLTCIMEIV